MRFSGLGNMRAVALALGVAVGVFVLSRAGVWLSLSRETIVSPLWPASGFGVAAVLLWGPRAAAGVWLGTLASDWLAGDPWPFVVLGPLGNAGEALAARWLLTRWWPIDVSFGRGRDVLRFFIGGVVLPPVLSALLGVIGLAAGGVVSSVQFPRVAALYWVANAAGILMVAPAMLGFKTKRGSDQRARAFPVAGLGAMALLMGAGLVAFGCEHVFSVGTWPLVWLPFPVVVWIAFTRGTHGAAVANLVISLIATLGTLFGHGPFAVPDALESLALLVTYNTLIAATALLLAAVRTELMTSQRRAHEMLAREAEWQALRAQVQPHFLFNALNSLRRLITSEPAAARDFTTRLAKLLRNSLSGGDGALVTLREELAAVGDYLELERFRFDERLRVAWVIAPASLDARLPPLVLLTLVENAVKHGIARLSKGGELRISAEQSSSGTCIICVTNPGPSGAASVVDEGESSGRGLANARNRLRLACGDAAGITLERKPGNIFAAVITLPRFSSANA